jgi:hypothetical protein
MGNEIYDELDELTAAPRVDIPEAALMLLEHAAHAIGAVRVEVVDELSRLKECRKFLHFSSSWRAF